jgi:arylsulfatase A-like enzyme
MDGKSFDPLLHGEPLPDARGHAYIASYTGGPEDSTPAPRNWARTIRSDRWRATFYPESDFGELYDLQEDPDEVDNRWRDPDCARIINEHRRILTDRLILLEYPLARAKAPV